MDYEAPKNNQTKKNSHPNPYATHFNEENLGAIIRADKIDSVLKNLGNIDHHISLI